MFLITTIVKVIQNYLQKILGIFLMAKITINNILASFASTTSINARFQQIEEELNNKVLYRDNPIGEANEMKGPLDMGGFGILNANALNIQDDSGVAIADAIGFAKEWAVNPINTLVSIEAGGDGVSEYSARHHAFFAGGSETNAAISASTAESAQTAAELILETFSDKYYGSLASDPSVAPSGGAITDGDMYFNTTVNIMRVYDDGATAWVNIGTAQNSAGSVTLSDAGNYYPTDNVEAALQDIATPSINGKGATLVGIENASGYVGSSTDVEQALDYLGLFINFLGNSNQYFVQSGAGFDTIAASSVADYTVATSLSVGPIEANLGIDLNVANFAYAFCLDHDGKVWGLVTNPTYNGPILMPATPAPGNMALRFASNSSGSWSGDYQLSVRTLSV